MRFQLRSEPGDQGEPISEQNEPATQRKTKPRQQLAEIGRGGGQDDVDRIAFQSAQEATSHAMIALEMPDLRFDRASPPAAPPFAA
jgi:hypothetical protein